MEELGVALRRAVTELGSTVGKGALLLAHSQLAQTFLEIPQGSDAVIRQLVAREVERQKPFSGPAVWQDEPSAPYGNGTGRLLHLLPRAVHDDLAAAFRSAGLQLTSVIPVSEAVPELNSGSGAAGGYPVLVGVLIPGGIVLSLRQRDGALLVRSIPLPICDPERIGAELRRTASFARQQFQISVARICLAGPAIAVEEVRRVGASSGLVFEVWAETALDYWATWAQTYGDQPRINLLSREYSEAPQRRVRSLWSQRFGLTCLGLATVLSLVLEFHRTKEVADQSHLRMELTRLEKSVVEARTVNDRMRIQALLVHAWDATVRLPVYLWLPGYLAERLADPLVVTNLYLVTQSSGWRLRLAGCVSSAGQAIPDNTVSSFLTELSDGPLQFEVGVADSPPLIGRSNLVMTGSWTQRLEPLTQESRPRPTRFQLEGTLP